MALMLLSRFNLITSRVVPQSIPYKWQTFSNDCHQLHCENSSYSILSSVEIMKFLVVAEAFLLVLVVTSFGEELGDGRPGCKTDEEIQVSVYRNLWDPTAFWKCETSNEAASSIKCPDQTAFQDSLKQCVPWDDWKWEELTAPPSKP